MSPVSPKDRLPTMSPMSSREVPRMMVIDVAELSERLRNLAKLANSSSFVPGQVCDWTSELRRLEEAVEEAERLEPAGAVGEVGEPEPEHPNRVEAMEEGLGQLQESVRQFLISPAFQDGEANTTNAASARARLLLPVFVQGVVSLLAKTWHLAQVQEMQVKRLSNGLMRAQAEIVRLEAQQQTLVSSEDSPSNKFDYPRTRMSAMETEWDLARARGKIEWLERDRRTVERQLLNTERARQKEAWGRCECERQLSALQKEGFQDEPSFARLEKPQGKHNSAAEQEQEVERLDGPCTNVECERLVATAKAEARQAEEERDESNRHLLVAKEALRTSVEVLNDAKEKLKQAQQAGDHIRMYGEKHAAELEAELARYQQQLLAVEQQRARGTAAPSTTRVTPRQPTNNDNDSGNAAWPAPAPPALEALQEEDEEEERPPAVRPSTSSCGTSSNAQNRARSVGKAPTGISARLSPRPGAAGGSCRVSIPGSGRASIPLGPGPEKPRSPSRTRGVTGTTVASPRAAGGDAQPTREAQPPSSPRKNGMLMQRSAQRRTWSPSRSKDEACTPPAPAPHLRRQSSPKSAMSRVSRCPALAKLASHPTVTASSKAAAEHSAMSTGGTGEAH